MRKFVLISASVAMLAIPSIASADKPDGTYTVKQGANGNASSIGVQSSAITQNGQFVSGNTDSTVIPDQTTTPGSRAALVQAALGH